MKEDQKTLIRLRYFAYRGPGKTKPWSDPGSDRLPGLGSTIAISIAYMIPMVWHNRMLTFRPVEVSEVPCKDVSTQRRGKGLEVSRVSTECRKIVGYLPD